MPPRLDSKPNFPHLALKSTAAPVGHGSIICAHAGSTVPLPGVGDQRRLLTACRRSHGIAQWKGLRKPVLLSSPLAIGWKGEDIFTIEAKGPVADSIDPVRPLSQWCLLCVRE